MPCSQLPRAPDPGRTAPRGSRHSVVEHPEHQRPPTTSIGKISQINRAWQTQSTAASTYAQRIAKHAKRRRCRLWRASDTCRQRLSWPGIFTAGDSHQGNAQPAKRTKRVTVGTRIGQAGNGCARPEHRRANARLTSPTFPSCEYATHEYALATGNGPRAHYRQAIRSRKASGLRRRLPTHELLVRNRQAHDSRSAFASHSARLANSPPTNRAARKSRITDAHRRTTDSPFIGETYTPKSSRPEC